MNMSARHRRRSARSTSMTSPRAPRRVLNTPILCSTHASYLKPTHPLSSTHIHRFLNTHSSCTKHTHRAESTHPLSSHIYRFSNTHSPCTKHTHRAEHTRRALQTTGKEAPDRQERAVFACQRVCSTHHSRSQHAPPFINTRIVS